MRLYVDNPRVLARGLSTVKAHKPCSISHMEKRYKGKRNKEKGTNFMVIDRIASPENVSMYILKLCAF